MRNEGHTSSEAGFTLLESLVALSILAIAFASLLGSFSGGLRAVDTTDDYVSALNLAETLLADRTSSRDFSLGRNRGVDRKFTWTVDVDPAAPREGAPETKIGDWNLFRISVRVAWSPKRDIRLEAFRLGKRRERDSDRL